MRWKYREEWNPLNCAQGNNHEHYGMLYRYLLLLFTLNHQSHAFYCELKYSISLLMIATDDFWQMMRSWVPTKTKHKKKTRKVDLTCLPMYVKIPTMLILP